MVRAKMPSEQRGCVNKPEHTYLRTLRNYALTTYRYLPTLAQQHRQLAPLAG